MMQYRFEDLNKSREFGERLLKKLPVEIWDRICAYLLMDDFLELREFYDPENELSLVVFSHDILGRSLFSPFHKETYRHIFNVFQDELLPPFIYSCIEKDLNTQFETTNLSRSQFYKYKNHFHVCHSEWFANIENPLLQSSKGMNWRTGIFAEEQMLYLDRMKKSDPPLVTGQKNMLLFVFDTAGPVSGHRFYEMYEWKRFWETLLGKGICVREDQWKKILALIRYFGRL